MDVQAAIKRIGILYGKEMAIKVESLFRNETKHFTSGNFLKCFCPGMEATIESFPYGWSSLSNFWKMHPEYAPIGIYKQVENTSGLLKSRGERKFIQFPNLDASMITVAERLKAKGGDTGAWFSNDPSKQKLYREYLLKIKTPYANEL